MTMITAGHRRTRGAPLGFVDDAPAAIAGDGSEVGKPACACDNVSPMGSSFKEIFRTRSTTASLPLFLRKLIEKITD
jgi:hypothetical protein